MNKADIINEVHEVLGGTKADAERTVEAFMNSIVSALKKGDEVALPGIGKFVVKRRAARQGRNPATGETIQIKASNVVGFKASKTLKDAIN